MVDRARLQHKLPIEPESAPTTGKPINFLGSAKVAFCFFGFVRVMLFPEVYRSLRDDFVRRVGGPGSMTFFMLYTDDKIPIGGAPLAAIDSHHVHELRDVINTFSPARFSIVQPVPGQPRAEFPPNCNCVMNRTFLSKEPPHLYANGEVMIRWIAIMTKQQKCFKMVEDQERRAGTRFDWVIRLRPDLHIEPPFLPYDFLQAGNKGRWPNVDAWFSPYYGWPYGISDQIIMLRRSYADNYFNIIDDYRQCDGNYEEQFGYRLNWSFSHPNFLKLKTSGARMALVPLWDSTHFGYRIWRLTDVAAWNGKR